MSRHKEMIERRSEEAGAAEEAQAFRNKLGNDLSARNESHHKDGQAMKQKSRANAGNEEEDEEDDDEDASVQLKKTLGDISKNLTNLIQRVSGKVTDYA